MSKLTSKNISKTLPYLSESLNANQDIDNGTVLETSFKDTLIKTTLGLCRLTRGITSKLVEDLVMTSAPYLETSSTQNTFMKNKVYSRGMLQEVAGLTNQCFNNQISSIMSPQTWTLLYAHQHND